MYVDPYWFGVLTTIGAEMLAIIVWAVVISNRGKKK